ncbi:MAG: helix-turn-helix domain-containing protein [Planctomycetota bacterium]|nr:helix-turn-helix domain-containing protein [Planctomycetota bacterium]
MKAPSQKQLYSRRESAQYLAISMRKIDKLAAEGELPRVKVGRATRFDLLDLRSLIERNKEGNK